GRMRGRRRRIDAMKLVVGVVVAAALGFADCGRASQADAMDCNAIQTAYASALLQVQVCDLAVPDSCGATRPRAPQDVCRCKVDANPAHTAELDQLLAQFQSQACPFQGLVCNRRCLSPAHACTAGAGSSPTCG